MSDFLTRRNGTWHFVRRVPTAFSKLDRRGIIRHSTRVKVADDRIGRRAARIAHQLNEELERYWRGLADGATAENLTRYDAARQRAHALGFDYVGNSDLIAFPLEKRLERLEALVVKGLVNDSGAREALLGTMPPPSFSLSRLFTEYEAITRDEVKDLSADQLRIWRNGRIRAVAQFVKEVGDKPVTEVTQNDAIDYVEWWRDRVANNAAAAKSANKDIGQLSRMLKDISIRRRLDLPDIFKGLRLRGEIENSRLPYEPEFIQNRLLAPGALAGLNEEARHVLYVMMETGLRPSEIVNLRENTIHLNASIPYVRIAPDGRRLKTEDSAREIPLVGVALKALTLRPQGFPNYRDKATNLSATVNKFLLENGLRPTLDYTLYSLRHSFKDRLVAAEAPDSLIDSLMGHKTYKSKYGKGPSLELKRKFLDVITFSPPARL
jgi:integrase